MIHRKHKNNKIKSAVIILILLTIALTGYLSIGYFTQTLWPFNNTVDISTQKTTDTPIEDTSSSESEIKNSQDGKKNSAPQELRTTDGTVSVGIAYAGYDKERNVVDIRAFTPDVIEGTGSCTASLTQGSNSLQRTVKAFIDSSTSQCEPIEISSLDFPTEGTWSLVVSYASDTSKGSSEEVKVEVKK